MADIPEDHGILLESSTRTDRGLYNEPIKNEDFWMARRGAISEAVEAQQKVPEDVRRHDMMRTAKLYTTLGELAEVVEAPVIAEKAFISASALMQGNPVPKGQAMTIDLNVSADRSDIRATLLQWAEENKDDISALPDDKQTEVMAKLDAALDLIESDISADLTEDTLWPGFTDPAASYLIYDSHAVEVRAAFYVEEDQQDLLNDFVNENVLENYVVTGQVPEKYEAIMPAVAEAYHEMHDDTLSDIPKRMQAYVTRAEGMGIDRDSFETRLIAAYDDLEANIEAERQDVAAIVAHRGQSLSDVEAVREAERDYHAFMLALGEIEQDIIDNSQVVDPEGFKLSIQDAASTAYTTNRADFESPGVGRRLLKSFVALEGKEAMREIAEGNTEALEEYIETPAHRRLAARELLKHAKTVDVGLSAEEVEKGLEAFDPNYTRSSGISL